MIESSRDAGVVPFVISRAFATLPLSSLYVLLRDSEILSDCSDRVFPNHIDAYPPHPRAPITDESMTPSNRS